MSKLKSKFALVILVGVAVLCAVPAFAVDGQILINQSTVMAAGGFPYKITQSGSYKLSGNLVVPANTNGIEINAGNVMLDLNGFTIRGPVVCDPSRTAVTCSGGTSGTGVLGSYQGMTVKNGFITGMGTAGIILGSSANLVEEIAATQNGTGIQMAGIIRRCNASFNGSFGIFIVGGVAENNETDSNGTTGIVALDAAVIGNESGFNIGFGLGVTQSIYGGNALDNNFGGTVESFGATSQNNNYCDGTVC
jgi:hypothetical protein